MYKTFVNSTFAILYAEETHSLEDIIELQKNHILTMKYMVGVDDKIDPGTKAFLNAFAIDMKIGNAEMFKPLLDVCDEVESVMNDSVMSPMEKIHIAKQIVSQRVLTLGIYKDVEEFEHDMNKSNLFISMSLGHPIIKVTEGDE